MKKSVKKSLLFGIVALLVLLVVGSAVASPLGLPGEPEPEPEIGRGGEREPEPGGGGAGGGESETEIIGPVPDSASLRGSGSDPANPAGTAVRINFEVSGHKALRGLYLLQEPGGDVLASWYALDGWTDSGWFENLDIASETIHVQALYYPGPDTKPTKMKIVNHAPGSAYGWVSRGTAHAIEVAWPEGTEMYASMEASADAIE